MLYIQVRGHFRVKGVASLSNRHTDVSILDAVQESYNARLYVRKNILLVLLFCFKGIFFFFCSKHMYWCIV